jgi:hypothetical protein
LARHEHDGTVEDLPDGTLRYRGNEEMLRRVLAIRLQMAEAEGMNMHDFVASLPKRMKGWTWAKEVPPRRPQQTGGSSASDDACPAQVLSDN